MAVDFRTARKRARSFVPIHRLSKSFPPKTARLFRNLVPFFIFALVIVATRQLLFFITHPLPDEPPSNKINNIPSISTTDSQTIGHHNFNNYQFTSEASVNLWRRIDHDCPAEKNPPNSSLYGTGQEHCYAIGFPSSMIPPTTGDPAAFWQMNSRSLCYTARPICLCGRRMDNVLSFDPRGSGKCSVLSVEKGLAFDARKNGLNESCAAFRNRSIIGMYGRELFFGWDEWLEKVKQFENRQRFRNRKSIDWVSNFAIVVPKYPWSYNICHYNRLWNYVMYVVRNLHLFVPDPDEIKEVDIMFRAGYKYDHHWHVGVREATLRALATELGKKINIRKLRYNRAHDFQCIRRGILLGAEGRIDSFPFFNDTPVWTAKQQITDSHVPVIPHDSLWFRDAVLKWSNLGEAGERNTNNSDNFISIPVPPLRVGLMQRSPYSKRRLTYRGGTWFENTLQRLAEKYQFQYVHIRTSAAMTLAEQVEQVHNLGLAVGLHGANMVNTVFMPAASGLFEIFPWRYVRFYYANGGNAGLRYSFHEPEGGQERNCSLLQLSCILKYREAVIYLTDRDREQVEMRLENAMIYLIQLHRKYPSGQIPLRRIGNSYHFDIDR